MSPSKFSWYQSMQWRFGIHKKVPVFFYLRFRDTCDQWENIATDTKWILTFFSLAKLVLRIFPSRLASILWFIHTIEHKKAIWSWMVSSKKRRFKNKKIMNWNETKLCGKQHLMKYRINVSALYFLVDYLAESIDLNCINSRAQYTNTQHP